MRDNSHEMDSCNKKVFSFLLYTQTTSRVMNVVKKRNRCIVVYEMWKHHFNGFRGLTLGIIMVKQAGLAFMMIAYAEQWGLQLHCTNATFYQNSAIQGMYVSIPFEWQLVVFKYILYKYYTLPLWRTTICLVDMVGDLFLLEHSSPELPV